MNITAQIAPIRRLTATVGAVRSGGGKSDHQVVDAGMLPDAITLTPTVGTVTDGISDLSGTPPLTFRTVGSKLYDYVIYGAQNGVGDYVGENLFDAEIVQGGMFSIGTNMTRVTNPDAVVLDAGTYKVSATKSTAADSQAVRIWVQYWQLGEDTTSGGTAGNNGEAIVSPATFTLTERKQVRFSFGYNDYVTTITPEHIENVTIAPAGADAPTITDGYAIPVTVMGKNLLENNCQSETYNGLTVTVNADKSITVNGTATRSGAIVLYDSRFYTGGLPASVYQEIANGSYILSGSPEGSAVGSYILSYRYTPAIGEVASQADRVSVDGVTLDNTSGAYKYLAVYIAVWQGTTLDNVTFRPMLRKSGTTDGYEPQYSNTVTIAIDKPLGVGETLSLSSTGVNIPTLANGTNTLSVGTAVAPAEVYIRYKT